jgi:glutathione peroxidase-family protein
MHSVSTAKFLVSNDGTEVKRYSHDTPPSHMEDDVRRILLPDMDHDDL